MEEYFKLMKLYFHAYLGIGDHFIYNGLIRKLSEVYEEVILPIRKISRPTIERLYEGNQRVTILDVLGNHENKEQSLIHERQGWYT